MGPFKKKQMVRSTTTLHDFFNPGAANLKKQSSKTQATQSKFKATRTSKQNEGTVLLQDIIIIDSDSDDEPGLSQVQGTQGIKRRRRLSESSDEVEFVDEVQPHKTIPSRGRKRLTRTGGEEVPREVSTKGPFASPDQVVFGEPGGILTSNTAQHAVFPSFGTPSLLFPITAQPPLSSTSSSTSRSFGSPTLLSCAGDQLLERKPHRPPSCPSPAPDVQTSISIDDSPQMDFEFSANVLDDDWGMGDDEVAFELSAGDEGDDIDDSTTSTPLDLSNSVPAWISGSATTSQTASESMQVPTMKLIIL
jgi:hypothetical protein